MCENKIAYLHLPNGHPTLSCKNPYLRINKASHVSWRLLVLPDLPLLPFQAPAHILDPGVVGSAPHHRTHVSSLVAQQRATREEPRSLRGSDSLRSLLAEDRLDVTDEIL